LIVDLPEDVPSGEVELIIRPLVAEKTSLNATLEAARAKLMAAGALSTAHRAPDNAVALTLEERIQLGTMPPGARPIESLIDEDRGTF